MTMDFRTCHIFCLVHSVLLSPYVLFTGSGLKDLFSSQIHTITVKVSRITWGSWHLMIYFKSIPTFRGDTIAYLVLPWVPTNVCTCSAFGKLYRPLDFFHILLRYSLFLRFILKKNPQQSTWNTPQSKNWFLEIENRNMLSTYVFRPLAMRLEIELRCILFLLIILEMFLQLDWSPPVVN